MAMEDKNTPVQPDAVEATETRGRKVGAARFFELLGRDLWPFYKASILCDFVLLIYLKRVTVP